MWNSKRATLLFALAGTLSLGLVLLAMPERRRDSRGGSVYRVELEIAGFHDADVNDFAQVRDTLDFHLDLLAKSCKAERYNGDVKGRPLDSETGYVRSMYNVDFASMQARQDALRALMAFPGLKFSRRGEDFGGVYAKVNGEMPVPRTGQSLRIEGWNFRIAKRDLRSGLEG